MRIFYCIMKIIRVKGVYIMATTNLTIRMDENLKKQVKELADDLGMDMTTFFNIYAKKAVRNWKIPFEVSADISNEETRKAIEDVKNGKNLSAAFNSVEEISENLRDDED